jgi:hypothetical protein
LKENFAGEDKKGMNGSKQINKQDFYFHDSTEKRFVKSSRNDGMFII